MQKLKKVILNLSKNIFSDILSFSGISRLLLRILLIIKPANFIFMYHRVNQKKNGLFAGLEVSIFENQIRCLARYFKFVTLSQLIDHVGLSREPLAAITFDDGYKNTLTNAFPVLKKNNISSTIFLTTGSINNDDFIWTDKLKLLKSRDVNISEETQKHLKRLPNSIKNIELNKLLSQTKLITESIPAEEKMLAWDDIKDMSKEGIEFGAHTVNHPILTNVDYNEAKKEINDSKLEIEAQIDRKVTTFCYPNGTDVDFNESIKQILKVSGFKCAVTAIEGKFRNDDDYFALKRISLGNRSPSLVILKIIKEILRKG